MRKEYFYLENCNIDKISIDDINLIVFVLLSKNDCGVNFSYNCIKENEKKLDQIKNKSLLKIYNDVKNNSDFMNFLYVVIKLYYFESEILSRIINQKNIDVYKRLIDTYNKLLTENKSVLKRSKKVG